jgi:hypothetical protein
MRDYGFIVEVQPVYPVALDDPAKGLRNLAYLSDEFIDALRFAADKARELGLRMDLTIGSGWLYGGSQVRVDQAAGKLRIERVDLPEGEGIQWKTLSSTRWASSASHIYGRPITSSETRTWLHSPAFRATPLDVKAEANVHFLQGVNQLIGHGCPSTAEGVEYRAAGTDSARRHRSRRWSILNRPRPHRSSIVAARKASLPYR